MEYSIEVQKVQKEINQVKVKGAIWII